MFIKANISADKSERCIFFQSRFYSSLLLPPAHEHADNQLPLCMWYDYYVFLLTSLVFTRLLLRVLPPYWITIWLIDDGILISVCLIDESILGFYYSNFT